MRIFFLIFSLSLALSLFPSLSLPPLSFSSHSAPSHLQQSLGTFFTSCEWIFFFWWIIGLFPFIASGWIGQHHAPHFLCPFLGFHLIQCILLRLSIFFVVLFCSVQTREEKMVKLLEFIELVLTEGLLFAVDVIIIVSYMEIFRFSIFMFHSIFSVMFSLFGYHILWLATKCFRCACSQYNISRF